jgi:hypothetical protein
LGSRNPGQLPQRVAFRRGAGSQLPDPCNKVACLVSSTQPYGSAGIRRKRNEMTCGVKAFRIRSRKGCKLDMSRHDFWTAPFGRSSRRNRHLYLNRKRIKSFRIAKPRRKLRWTERGRDDAALRPMDFSDRTWCVGRRNTDVNGTVPPRDGRHRVSQTEQLAGNGACSGPSGRHEASVG